MSDNPSASWNRDSLLENFAAEVTSAAYAVALRHGVEDKWLDLQLDLWEALRETVKKWDQGSARPLTPTPDRNAGGRDSHGHAD